MVQLHNEMLYSNENDRIKCNKCNIKKEKKKATYARVLRSIIPFVKSSKTGNADLYCKKSGQWLVTLEEE